METFFDLLPFLFVLYVLLRAFRRKSKGAGATAAGPGQGSVPSTFSEVFRRIEQAAAEAQRQAAAQQAAQQGARLPAPPPSRQARPG